MNTISEAVGLMVVGGMLFATVDITLDIAIAAWKLRKERIEREASQPKQQK
jgi:hypothetical protein